LHCCPSYDGQVHPTSAHRLTPPCAGPHAPRRYVDSQGHLVRYVDKIALNYLKMWFWIDL